MLEIKVRTEDRGHVAVRAKNDGLAETCLETVMAMKALRQGIAANHPDDGPAFDAFLKNLLVPLIMTDDEKESEEIISEANRKVVKDVASELANSLTRFAETLKTLEDDGK